MKIVQKIITVLFALLFFGGTLLFEFSYAEKTVTPLDRTTQVAAADAGFQLVRNGQAADLKDQTELLVGDVLQTKSAQSADVSFSDHGLLRVSSGSRLLYVAEDKAHDGYIFQLQQGRVWVNTEYTTATLNLISGVSMLVPRKATFDVKIDNDQTQLNVFTNQVGVSLIKPDYAPQRIVRFLADGAVNSFVVAQGNQAVLYGEKIRTESDAISQLLYSKLIKEFQYGLFDKAEIRRDDWVKSNLAQDDIYSQSVAQSTLREINNRKLAVDDLDSIWFQLKKSTDAFADVLTFSADKVRNRNLDNIFNQFADAQYLLIYGRTNEAKTRLNLFSQLLTDALSHGDDTLKQDILSRLRTAYLNLNFVTPDDPLFVVKSSVSDLLYQQLGSDVDGLTEKISLVRDYLDYAYTLADSNALLARISLGQYFDKISALIKKEKLALTSDNKLLAEENQLVESLFRQYPQFYQDVFFASKHNLETEWLSLLPEGESKNEERQTLISSKIDFLKQLQEFFLSEKVALRDAQQVALRLINEIKDLQTGESIGVSDLFALRLKDYGQFLRFLNSAEFGNLKGLTMRDKYNNFLQQQSEQVSIDQAIQEFLGQNPTATPSITPDQILAQVRADFAAAQIQDLQLGAFGTADQRYIPVNSASLGGIVFQGQYDWDKKLISQVRVGAEMVSENPIRLSQLTTLLVPPPVETQVVTQQQTVPTPAPDVSKAERVAKILLIQKLKLNDIAALDANVVVSDLSGGVFIVQGGNLISSKNVQLAFIFQNKENTANSVVVRTPLGDQKLEGVYPLADLSTAVKDFYDAASKEAKQASAKP